MNRAFFGNDSFASCDADLEWEDELDEILDELDEHEMRGFLRILANEDDRVGRRIVAQFGAPDVLRTQTDLNADIDSIWNRYEYRGYVDYRKSLEFQCEMHRAFLNAVNPLMRPTSLNQAFRVSYAFLLRLEDIEIDDSNGFFSSMTDLCAESWEKMLSLALQLSEADRRSIRKDMCDSLCAFVKANPVRDRTGVYPYLSDEVVEFLVEQFAGDVAPASSLIELFDYKLAEVAKGSVGESGLSDYEQVR